jgi:hypothetical protein
MTVLAAAALQSSPRQAALAEADQAIPAVIRRAGDMLAGSISTALPASMQKTPAADLAVAAAAGLAR